MNFVDLNRYFIPIAKDREPSLDLGRMWGRKLGGWLSWPDILKHDRVVLRPLRRLFVPLRLGSRCGSQALETNLSVERRRFF